MEEELEKKDAVNADNELEQLKKALNYERTARKKAEAELANSVKAQSEEDEIKKFENEIRAKLKNSKSEFSEETIEDLMSAFGRTQAENQVKSKKQNIERDILELKRNQMYMDAEEYGSEIRSMMREKGLTAEQAYWAVAGAKKMSNSKTEEEDNKKAKAERASEGYVDTKPAGKEERTTYTSKERTMAETMNKSPEEIRERNTKSIKLENILKMNKKFKKED